MRIYEGSGRCGGRQEALLDLCLAFTLPKRENASVRSHHVRRASPRWLGVSRVGRCWPATLNAQLASPPRDHVCPNNRSMERHSPRASRKWA